MAMKKKITKIQRGGDKHPATDLDTERSYPESSLSNDFDLGFCINSTWMVFSSWTLRLLACFF